MPYSKGSSGEQNTARKLKLESLLQAYPTKLLFQKHVQGAHAEVDSASGSTVHRKQMSKKKKKKNPNSLYLSVCLATPTSTFCTGHA